ncbi:hypothetical protein DRJ48_00170 [Candidatus Woesearchaeota archaeon]|nr:MAG: hypothetical protein DRJ48_00170 [Candidatus Woesearchaeota archaeon]
MEESPKEKALGIGILSALLTLVFFVVFSLLRYLRGEFNILNSIVVSLLFWFFTAVVLHFKLR